MFNLEQRRLREIQSGYSIIKTVDKNNLFIKFHKYLEGRH